MKGINTGYGTQLPLWAVFNLYVIFIITSIPGLAISPIMGDLTRIFPGTSQLETQFLTLGPNIAAIPFVFLGGWIGTRFNNMKLLNWTCLFYGIGGALFFVAPNMITLIILSFAIGIAAGICSPLASAFVSDLFGGTERTKQYGYTSAVLNLVLMASTIATGYLAKVNWRLPFLIYLLPFVPLFFAHKFKGYIKEPTAIRSADAQKKNAPKVHYKFTQNVNMKMLIRYCAYYFFITLVIAAISLYVPFRFTNSSTAGDLTSILFLGIMASGFTLNFALKFIRKFVAIACMIAIAVGFILMTFSAEAVVVGIGILLASYFYGIAQPYYYDRLSNNTSRVALTLTMAWFAVMDSIGNVVAPFIIDGIAKVFGSSASKDPQIAFRICMYMCFIALAIVIIRKVIVIGKNHGHDNDMKDHPLGDSVNPIS
ncbi:MAG: MFS transporter [Muribaculaceae bacterium]|nr:MFS transporter [Muribaculaceae bacterium]